MTAAQAAKDFGAQFYLPYIDDKETPTLFYRRAYQVFNDGSVAVRLQQLTFASLWHFSGEKDQRKFLAERLVPIDDAPQETARSCGSPETTLTEAELRDML